MKVKAGELVKNLPSELRELAIQRAKEQRKNIEQILEQDVNYAFTWCSTKEGHTFWSDVHRGIEFTLPTEKFKRGDLVEAVSGYDKGVKGIYIGLNSSDVNTSIIQRIDGDGWTYQSCRSSFPSDFTPASGTLFWNIDTVHLAKRNRPTETAKPTPTPKFQMGDRVSTTYGMNGWFVCYTDTGTCIIERDETGGWPRTSNPDLIPLGYVCRKHESFWSTGESALVKLAKKVEEKVEEKTKPTGFQVGDRVEARRSGWQNGVGRVMEKGEKGIITKISGELINLKAERDGVEICRIEEFLTKVPHVRIDNPDYLPPEGRRGAATVLRDSGIEPSYSSLYQRMFQDPSSMWKGSRGSGVGIWHQLQEEGVRHFYSPYDTFGASTSVVERHPGAVLISKKKTKRRLL